MAVKKHGLVSNSSNKLDLQALAQYIQLMNKQPGYLPPVPDLVKNCQDIVKCLACSTGNEDGRWEILQSIEEFLLRIVNAVDEEARTAIVNAVIDKLYSYMSDPQSDADAAASIVLVVLETASAASLQPRARWVVQQGGDSGPAAAGLRASLSCLYSWLADNPPQGTPVLGDWVMSFIKALEEKQCFDILIEVSVKKVARLFCAMKEPATLRQASADVILHVLAALRKSLDAFHKISKYVEPVLTSLASDSGQFSRQLLQNIVDILSASVEHLLNKYKCADKVSFKDKYSEVIACLERHMASRGCEQLKTAPWPEPAEAAPASPAPACNKVGLLNLGNTCYMNSVMQALLLTHRFSSHVMLQMSERPYWEIAALLFGQLAHSVGDKVDSREFFEAMRPPFFSLNHQQDSSEFLGYLFELLKSYEHVVDLDHDYSKPPVLGSASQRRPAGNTHSDSEAAGSGYNRRAVSPRPGGSGESSNPATPTMLPLFEEHTIKHYTYLRDTMPRLVPLLPIGCTSSGKRSSCGELEYPGGHKRARVERRASCVDSTFGGVLLTRVRCAACRYTSVRRDVCRDLALAFPDQQAEHSVQSLIEYFCQKEVLSGENCYLCPDCGALREAERTVLIETPPKILILVLKHFKFEAKLQVQSKLVHKMHYNHSIHLPQAGGRRAAPRYTLYAAVVHHGPTLDSGHYYTLAKDGGSWYEFNDEEVSCAAESRINELQGASTPYLVFYRREDEEPGAAPALHELPARLRRRLRAHNKRCLAALPRALPLGLPPPGP